MFSENEYKWSPPRIWRHTAKAKCIFNHVNMYGYERKHEMHHSVVPRGRYSNYFTVDFFSIRFLLKLCNMFFFSNIFIGPVVFFFRCKKKIRIKLNFKHKHLFSVLQSSRIVAKKSYSGYPEPIDGCYSYNKHIRRLICTFNSAGTLTLELFPLTCCCICNFFCAQFERSFFWKIAAIFFKTIFFSIFFLFIF